MSLGPLKYGYLPRYGCVPDLANRVPKLSARASIMTDAELPAEADLSAALPQRLNQVSEGSCVAHSVTTALRYNWINDGQPDMALSRNQLYYDCRKREGTVDSDAGCQIHTAIDVAMQVGVCSEGLWPYDLTKWADAPPDSVYADAVKHEGLEKWSIDVDPLAIRTALYLGKPVIIGITVYPSFESDEVAATGMVPMPGPNENILAGHSMLIFGRKPGFFLTRNWWGEGWGAGGDCFLPEAYFTPEYASDLWVIATTEAP